MKPWPSSMILRLFLHTKHGDGEFDQWSWRAQSVPNRPKPNRKENRSVFISIFHLVFLVVYMFLFEPTFHVFSCKLFPYTRVCCNSQLVQTTATTKKRVCDSTIGSNVVKIVGTDSNQFVASCTTKIVFKWTCSFNQRLFNVQEPRDKWQKQLEIVSYFWRWLVKHWSMICVAWIGLLLAVDQHYKNADTLPWFTVWWPHQGRRKPRAAFGAVSYCLVC